jgi:NitT/TauT family transport system substrate-binding protein
MQGYRRIFEVRDAEAALGLNEPVALIGYAFSEQFAAEHRSAIDRFIAAARKADDIMLRSDQEWDALRPLMKAEDEATFKAYRDLTREGMPRRPISEEEADARALFGTLASVGGPDLLGPASELDAGLYYHPAAAGD